MSKRKVQTSFMNIGASSLLVIFLTLCIAVFAVLSLSGAKSDYSFSLKTAEYKTAYYTACNKSEEVIAAVDAGLSDIASSCSGKDSFYQKASAELKTKFNETDLTVHSQNEIPTVSWKIQINDTQYLYTEIMLQWTSDKKDLYSIKKWQVISD